MRSLTAWRRAQPRRFRGAGAAAVAVLVILAGVLFLSEEPMPLQAQTFVQQADRDYQAGHFEAAAAAYREAWTFAPASARILEQLGVLALLNNRAQEAAGHFEEALRQVPWYGRVWPLTAQLKARLAMAYYRQDRFADAARLFREAAGPLPLGPFQSLDALARQTALFADLTPYSLHGPAESRLEFVATDPLPVVSISVNGGEPFHAILDTGGAEVILDDDLARAVQAEMAGAFSGSYGGGRQAQTGLGRIDSLQVGAFSLENVPIHTLDTDSISAAFQGLTIKGILGTRFFQHFLTTIDYRGGALILRRPEAAAAQPTAAAAVEIPFWLAEMHYLLAQGQFNDQDPTLFFVDTGLAGQAFTAPEAALQQAGIALDWTQAAEGVGGAGAVRTVAFTVGRLALGSGAAQVVETSLPGIAMEGSVAPLGDGLGFHIGGLISHAFFRNHAVTFDFTRMRLVIE